MVLSAATGVYHGLLLLLSGQACCELQGLSLMLLGSLAVQVGRTHKPRHLAQASRECGQGAERSKGARPGRWGMQRTEGSLLFKMPHALWCDGG